MSSIEARPDTAPDGGPETGPRRVGRRAVLRSAVWTVPVVAVAAAAPAFAASCTTLYAGSLNWSSNYTRASTSSGSASVTLGGTAGTVGISLASTFASYTPNAANLAVSTNGIGGLGSKGLTLWQAVNGAQGANPNLNDVNKNQTMVMTFDRQVYNLSFTMTDIDSATGDFLDAVALVANGSYSAVKATNVTGTGTKADPFKATGNNTVADNVTGTTGNVTITFTQPVTQLTFIYWNKQTNINTDPDQTFYLSNMTFSAYNLGC